MRGQNHPLHPQRHFFCSCGSPASARIHCMHAKAASAHPMVKSALHAFVL